MDQAGPARRRVADAFAHREGDRVPLWSIIENRGVYEHVLGPGRVGRAEEVGLDDKLRLHAEVYGALGIDITRAQLWPPDPEQAGGPATHWRTREATADDVHTYRPQLPDAAGRQSSGTRQPVGAVCGLCGLAQQPLGDAVGAEPPRRDWCAA